MEKIKLKINDKEYSVNKDATILEACREAAIEIPTLCYMKDTEPFGSCRICLVEVKGMRTLIASCAYPVSEGMEIYTNTPHVHETRKTTLELMLSDHNKDCLSCVRNQNCDLQKMCIDFGVEKEDHYAGKMSDSKKDESTASIVRDNSKCIMCRRCVAACKNVQEISVIGPNDRGFETNIGCAFDVDLSQVPCIECGQCVIACPVGALYEKDDTAAVWKALNDPTKHVAVCAAPSIRVSLGECFGDEPGTFVEGKMVAALKALGFDGVYDMNLTADLTVMEEGNELIERIHNNGKLPMITSCSPGWVKYCELYFPEFIPNLSSCKSPQQMFGAIYKTRYAKKLGLDPKDIFFVSVIPCTAKKFELTRDNQSAVGGGIRDVDAAITTRELGRMIAKAGLNWNLLKDAEFDSVGGYGSGAGVIFGTTGGVMEASLRTAAESILGKSLEKVDYCDVRGSDGIKYAQYKLGDLTVRVAVASGAANAKKLLTAIKNGETDVDFIEIMACPGGCICGGGQPIQPITTQNFVNIWEKRANGLYSEDERKTIRKAHENPIIKEIYEDYLGKPGSDLAHKILHTSYEKRQQY